MPSPPLIRPRRRSGSGRAGWPRPPSSASRYRPPTTYRRRWSPQHRSDGTEPSVARALIDVWTTTPWISATSLATISRRPPSRPSSPPVPDPTQPVRLSRGVPRLCGPAQDQTAHYEALVAEPDPLTDSSSSPGCGPPRPWPDESEAGVAYTRLATAEVRDRLAQVSVHVPESVTLSSSKEDSAHRQQRPGPHRGGPTRAHRRHPRPDHRRGGSTAAGGGGRERVGRRHRRGGDQRQGAGDGSAAGVRRGTARARWHA